MRRWWLNHMNTEQFEPIVEFYKQLGFVEDSGSEHKPGAPVIAPKVSISEGLGFDISTRIEGDDRASRVMLRLPGDIVRLEIFGWQPGTMPDHGPRSFNAKGLVRVGLLVDDLEKELEAVRARGIPVIWENVVTWLNWQEIKMAFIEDPDGNLIEFIECSDVLDVD